jgi:N-acetyl-D-muramate 6-phosphate phosphatase
LSFKGILFDLDGTLVDTAPDLVAVLNAMLAQEHRPPVPYAVARNEVSNGALGMIRLGFKLPPDSDVSIELRHRFLSIYASLSNANSRLFIPVAILNELTSALGARWGIVTNKPEALTLPLVSALKLDQSVGVVVSGDTLPQRKPDPAPLLLAARELGLDPGQCVYLGDAHRDILAGRAAGMRTIATTYGYIRPDTDVASWQADAEVDHPRKIGPMLLKMSDAG